MYLDVQVSKSLGRLIVQTFTADGSNHLLSFPVCTECKKRRTEAYKETKN